MKRIFVIAAVMALVAVTAHGATVEFWGTDLGGGQFEIYMTDTVGASSTNRGIQGVDLMMSGSVTAFTFDLNLQNVVSYPPPVSIGFVTQGQTVVAPNYNITAAQTDFTNVFVGVGQGAVAHTGPFGSIAIANPVKLGVATYTGAVPTNVTVAANLLEDDGSGGYKSVATDAVWIPEPMTLTLLGIGGLALIRRRK